MAAYRTQPASGLSTPILIRSLPATCSSWSRPSCCSSSTSCRQSQIYPTYAPLVRTGRSSCSDPNLQQLPRDTRFREMITAAPGYQLLQIDYSALELRTLAAICLQRYGRSQLAELFAAGVDPHQYTAALAAGADAGAVCRAAQVRAEAAPPAGESDQFWRTGRAGC